MEQRWRGRWGGKRVWRVEGEVRGRVAGWRWVEGVKG